MEPKFNYNQRMDVKFPHQTIIDVNKIVEECTFSWFNQTLTKVNNSVVRLGIIEGEYHWHKHEEDDEFFFVLNGKLFVDTETQTFELLPNQGITISKGVKHRTRAPIRTVILMVETEKIDPIGTVE